jgi:hypothetical protein
MSHPDPDPPATAKASRDASPHRRGFDEVFGVAGEGTVRALARLIGVLALGAAVGWSARFVRMPLPFVLGPLVATAALGLAGFPVVGVRRLRPGAQFVIGSAIGIQFTRAVVLTLVKLLPLIVGAALLSMAVCAAASVFLILAAGLDGRRRRDGQYCGALRRGAGAHHGGADHAGGADRHGGAVPGDPFRQ